MTPVRQCTEHRLRFNTTYMPFPPPPPPPLQSENTLTVGPYTTRMPTSSSNQSNNHTIRFYTTYQIIEAYVDAGS
jgi:hypothetical protein